MKANALTQRLNVNAGRLLQEYGILYWNKFGMPRSVLSRFGGEDDAVALWWADPAAEAALADAMATGAPLPPPDIDPAE